MYVCIRKECVPLGHTKRYVFSLLQNDVSVSVGSGSEDGKEFHSFYDSDLIYHNCCESHIVLVGQDPSAVGTP